MSDDVSWHGRDGDGELGLVAKISVSSVTQKLSSMTFSLAVLDIYPIIPGVILAKRVFLKWKRNL